jgi:hypothetical protein
MSGTDQLQRRARVLEQLADRYRQAAEHAQGPRAAALRKASRQFREEALRFTLAAARSQR